MTCKEKKLINRGKEVFHCSFNPITAVLKRNLLSLFILIGLLQFNAIAKSEDSTRSSFFDKHRILPSGYYTPETRLSVGIALLSYYQNKDSNTRASNSEFYLDFTTNKQILFQSDFNIYTKNNRFQIKGNHDLTKFPEFYFGIGNESSFNDRCLLDYKLANLRASFAYQVFKDGYAGLIAHHQTLFALNKEVMVRERTYSMSGYSLSGLGAVFRIDKRDYVLNPQRGYYLETSVIQYQDHKLMENGCIITSIDARHYHTFKNKLVLNSNMVCVNGFGDVPFRMMPKLGGPRFLRGMYQGRYRDNNMVFAQAELRRKLFWRVGAAAFTGFGQVYHTFESFSVNQFHYNYGMGLRFEINEESKANIRIDVGKTQNSHGLYIVYAEAF